MASFRVCLLVLFFTLNIAGVFSGKKDGKHRNGRKNWMSNEKHGWNNHNSHENWDWGHHNSHEDWNWGGQHTFHGDFDWDWKDFQDEFKSKCKKSADILDSTWTLLKDNAKSSWDNLKEDIGDSIEEQSKAFQNIKDKIEDSLWEEIEKKFPGARSMEDGYNNGGKHHDDDQDVDFNKEKNLPDWKDWGWGDWDKSYDHDSEDRDHHHGKRHHEGFYWLGQAGIGIIVLVGFIICGLISLVSWLSCFVYGRCKKNKVGNPKGVPSASCQPPAWSTHLVYNPKFAAGFGTVSNGFTSIGQNTLVRSRQGLATTDGAMWSMPMTTGKHVFEITWPWTHRGNSATIGVATPDAPLTTKGAQPLVGGNAHTWGLDIVKRRTLHRNKIGGVCPTDGSYVPDKFLMYINMDDGVVGFGNEVTYWGDVIKNLPKKQPLSVMIGVTRWQAEVSVAYKGSEHEGEKGGEPINPPHHLPSLYENHSDLPSYEESKKSIGEPLMVLPMPTAEAPAYYEDPKPSSPPPAYRSPSPGGANPV